MEEGLPHPGCAPGTFPAAVAISESTTGQAATYTERALRRLFRSLDRNPALAERVVRKGKQAECERRGLLSFLWVRPAGRGRGARGRGRPGAPASPPPPRRGRRGGDFPEAAAQASGFLRPALPVALAGQGVVCGPGGAERL